MSLTPKEFPTELTELLAGAGVEVPTELARIFTDRNSGLSPEELSDLLFTDVLWGIMALEYRCQAIHNEIETGELTPKEIEKLLDEKRSLTDTTINVLAEGALDFPDLAVLENISLYEFRSCHCEERSRVPAGTRRSDAAIS